MEGSAEPAVKRQKTSHDDHPRQQSNSQHSQHKKHRHNKAQYQAQPKTNGKASGKFINNHRYTTRQISASGISSGDVGVLVTSDKGKEKRALREVEGLVEGLWEVLGVNYSGAGGGGQVYEDGDLGNEAENGGDRAGQVRESIEDDIEAELRELRGEKGSNGVKDLDVFGSSGAGPKLELVMLDIPCVSFLRIVPPRAQSQRAPNLEGTAGTGVLEDPYDPVAIVYAICRSAYKDPAKQKSRFVRRLTPVTKWRKILAHTASEPKDADASVPAESTRGLTGLEKLCLEVLPPVFAPENCPVDSGTQVEGQRRWWKYAIRVTVRNNDKFGREDVIRIVAGFVVGIGRGEGRERVEGGDEEEEGRGRRNSSSEVEDSPKPDVEVKVAGSGTSAVEEGGTEKLRVDHAVSLKAYEKLVMVDVYRNVVGMSVIGEASEFEDQLRRFNLAEIYAEGRKRIDGKELEGEGAEIVAS
jgi:hypothetical protein